MSTLALVMIVRNEEKHIARCLASVAPYVDEIIIADTGSTDRTIAIAEPFNAKISHYEWNNDFSSARNYALSQSTCDWNLILDADEYIESFDSESIRRFMELKQAVGRIHRISETLDGNERNYTSDYMTRFIPRGLQFTGRIHEQVVTELPRTNIPIIVQHDGYLGSSKSSRNIPILLEEIAAKRDDPYYYYQLAKEYKGIDKLSESLKAFQKALQLLTHKERYAPNVLVDYMYALQKAGKYVDVLKIIRNQPDYVESFPDFFFASGVIYLEIILNDPDRYMPLLPLIEQSYRRCLDIGETDKYDTVRGTGSYAAWYNLGNYYGVLGQTEQALICYQQSAKLGYMKANDRINEMDKE